MSVPAAAGAPPGSVGRGKDAPVPRHPQDMTISTPQAGCGSGPPVDVRAWRRCRLLEAGFTPALAEGVASDRRFDLHALLQLVDRGCPPELAVRILAPLPSEAAP